MDRTVYTLIAAQLRARTHTRTYARARAHTHNIYIYIYIYIRVTPLIKCPAVRWSDRKMEFHQRGKAQDKETKVLYIKSPLGTPLACINTT